MMTCIRHEHVLKVFDTFKY